MRVNDILKERQVQAKAILDGDWTNITELAKLVAQRGGRTIGHGKFSIAYVDPSYKRYVIKVVHNWDEPFLDYIGFCEKNKSPYLLKIFGHRIHETDDDRFFVAMTEFLKPASIDKFRSMKRTIDVMYHEGWEPDFNTQYDGDHLYLEIFQGVLYDWFEGKDLGEAQRILDAVNKSEPGLLDVLYKVASLGHHLDLHLYNWGMRGNQLVLLDPLFDQGKLQEMNRFGSGFSGGI